MEDIRLFRVENGLLQLNTHKVVVRAYKTKEKDDYVDTEYFVDEVGLQDLITNIGKHKSFEITEQTELDTSAYDWVKGLSVDLADRENSIRKILSYGNLDDYKSAQPEAKDEYLLDLDCRVSMIELGVTE